LFIMHNQIVALLLWILTTDILSGRTLQRLFFTVVVC
jgi:hypothetical protein